MLFERRVLACLRRAASGVLLAAVGCGPGILSPMPNDELVRAVRVKVDLSEIPEGASPARLTLGIAWGASWETPSICHLASSDSVVQRGCRSPFAFVLSQLTPVADLDREEDGAFVLDLPVFPPEPVAVGAAGAWVAYGSVVVLRTREGSESLPWRDVRRWQYLAASVVDISQPHTRLVARWGVFDKESPFYPYPVETCGEPPPGFSVLSVGAVDSTLRSGPCELWPLETAPPVVLEPLSYVDAHSLGCPAQRDPHEVLRPLGAGEAAGAIDGDDAADPATAEIEQACVLDDTVYVQQRGAFAGLDSPSDIDTSAAIDGICPETRVWALVGCPRNLSCAGPKWDLRQAPPADWPCGVEGSEEGDAP